MKKKDNDIVKYKKYMYVVSKNNTTAYIGTNLKLKKKTRKQMKNLGLIFHYLINI